MSTPAWAVELTALVCADSGIAPPRLRWRQWSGDHSSGLTRRDQGTVSVRAGTDTVDQRLTLLHELAHWLSPAPRRARRRRAEHHGRAFYLVAFDLYDRYGISSAHALRLESGRYRSSLRHAAAIGVPGAQAALAEHRARIRARPRRSWTVLVAEHTVRLERTGRWHVCATCGQRVVGITLARIRRGHRPVRHTIMTSRV
ncbi:MAG TPA: hypothetical protein VJ839_00515 [Candidatus Limnocylindria bacterium]|nr:hypothetical protein [Candidatus Limnocylindria bacterium]